MTQNQYILVESGDPNGAYAAPPGTMAHDLTGNLWYKASGTGNTGWSKVGAANSFNFLTIVATSSSLSFTGSFVDIPGATLTLTATGTWLILASGGLNLDPVDTSSSIQLLANGVAQTGTITENSTGSAIEGRSASRQWTYAATSGHVVKLQGKKNSGGGASGTPNNWVLTAIQLS